MKTTPLFLFLALLTFSVGLSQNYKTHSLNQAQLKKVDSLTSHWNKNDSPGGAIAIIHKNKVIYQNTLGLADLESGKKNTPKTSFPLAQITDNFVAYALILAFESDLLSLEDELQKYLPYTNHLNKKLKVKHLLEKSTGLHDFEILKNIAGWSDASPFSSDDVTKLISNQNQLSFKSGTEFSNSRTDIVLAAEVIEKTSGMSFATYMQKQVFEPLEMKNSFVLDKTNQMQANLAKSYRLNEEGVATLVPSKKETYVSINIASSIEDMIRWEQNLSSPSDKTKKVVEKFNSFVKLKNGKEYKVPMGKITYGQKYTHKERGIDTQMVTGGIDGFASAIFNFPDEDFTVITLSNNGEGYNGYIGMLSAHSILNDAFLEPTSTDFSIIKTIKLNPSYHKKYEGWYWDALGELSREIRIVNDTLRYMRNGNGTALVPLSKDKFQMKTDFDDKIYLTFNDNNGTISMQYAYGDATPFHFVKYSKPTITEETLKKEYEGHYYCEVLGLGYELKAKNNTLLASNVKADDIILTPIMNNIFAGDKWYLGSIEFQKNDSGEILGFYVKNDAIRNLWFKKLSL